LKQKRRLSKPQIGNKKSINKVVEKNGFINNNNNNVNKTIETVEEEDIY